MYPTFVMSFLSAPLLHYLRSKHTVGFFGLALGEALFCLDRPMMTGVQLLSGFCWSCPSIAHHNLRPQKGQALRVPGLKRTTGWVEDALWVATLGKANDDFQSTLVSRVPPERLTTHYSLRLLEMFHLIDLGYDLRANAVTST
ncbi:hypothetical protein N656DRAFT_181309 [Canariomyces notabilis]|uniref:Uncharacterized protein n=1 Tax=Canariomyces notabilis TaxID=2074819 RepID=A0AAN6QR61_9PEZI|nr:hypothetical protein N656DRAFT_181309 [Canariomyces arenarius]